MPDIAGWFYDRTNTQPDFKQTVEKSLWLFAAFTGVAFTFYVRDFLFGQNLRDFHDFPGWSRILIAAAVITLLLRYLVGSAVHLNGRYVAKAAPTIEEVVVANAPAGAPRTFDFRENKTLVSGSLGWLFFDIAFLVTFGVLAVFITFAPDLAELMRRSAYFLGAGLLWSILAGLYRPTDYKIAHRWIAIDGAQLVLTLALIYVPCQGQTADLIRTAILAAAYVLCLFVDFAVVSRPKR
jgi:hypothetical protein